MALRRPGIDCKVNALGLDLKHTGLRCRAEGCLAIFRRAGDQVILAVLQQAESDRVDHERRAHGLVAAEPAPEHLTRSALRRPAVRSPATAEPPSETESRSLSAGTDQRGDDIRHRIIALLGRQGPLLFEQILTEIEARDSAVRRQLKVLVAAGLVRIEPDATRLGRGRPHYRYALSERTATTVRRHHDALAEELLLDAKAIGGEELIERIFLKRCDRLELRYRDRVDGKPLRDRVREIARILEENGAVVEWRQIDERSFAIRERDSTIFNVARDDAVACRYELTLLERLLGAEVRRDEPLASGDAACSYVVTPRETG